MTNLFEGFSCVAQCVRAWDELLREKQWVSTADVQDRLGYSRMSSTLQLSYDKAIKKAKHLIQQELRAIGWELRVEDDHEDRRVSHTAYPEGNPDPLHNLRIMAVVDESMKAKKALRIAYSPAYEGREEYVFHPQYVRTYNNRLFVYGEKDDQKATGRPFDTIAVDRILSAELTDEPCRQRSTDYYLQQLESVVGASPNFEHPDVLNVRIRTHAPKMHMLLLTKPLHRSQREICRCTDTASGEFLLRVQLTLELRSWIKHYGSQLEVIAPEELRAQVASEIEDMHRLYSK